MPKFHYTGRDDTGVSVRGNMEGSSADNVASQLIQSGIIPLNISEQQTQTDILYEIRNIFGLERPSKDELILFCRQCYALTKAGVPIIQGFSLLSESCKNRMFSETIRKMSDDLEGGRELSVAMARHPEVFSQLFVNIIRVGETSGRLDEAFLLLHDYLERDKETVNQIKAAVRYPIFVLITLVAAIFILMIFVIPGFKAFYEANRLTLPTPTVVIMEISEFMVAYWPLLLFIALSGVILFRAYINSEAGRLWWDAKKIRFILIGDIILRAVLARFSRTLSMALKSGVPILQAITITGNALGNVFITSMVLQMREGIERGESLTRSANKCQVFTPIVLQMIAIGEETGRMDEMLDEVADFYEREVDYDVKHITSIIEPLLTIGLAGLVLLLFLAIGLPMWDLVQMLNR